jgi:hypothetical protein
LPCAENIRAAEGGEIFRCLAGNNFKATQISGSFQLRKGEMREKLESNLTD